MQEVINIPHKISKSNTGDSSNKSGTGICLSSRTPGGEGHRENLATEFYTPKTARFLATKLNAQKKLMLPKTKLRTIRINVPSLCTHTPIQPTTTVDRRQKIMPWSSRKVRPPLPCLSRILRLLLKLSQRPK